MLLAELEIRHSRPIAPTRRVALGRLYLPTDPSPGFGGILLGAIVGANAAQLEEELLDGYRLLLDELEQGRHVTQPRLRHRFQRDAVGLDRSEHRLLGEGEVMVLEIDQRGYPLPQVLGAAYAAGLLTYAARTATFRVLRKALHWEGAADDRLLSFLTGDEAAYKSWTTEENDERWALRVLGFDRAGGGVLPGRNEVQRRYRDLIRAAHPDHGGDTDRAGRRITELTEARRILLAVAS